MPHVFAKTVSTGITGKVGLLGNNESHNLFFRPLARDEPWDLMEPDASVPWEVVAMCRRFEILQMLMDTGLQFHSHLPLAGTRCLTQPLEISVSKLVARFFPHCHEPICEPCHAACCWLRV